MSRFLLILCAILLTLGLLEPANSTPIANGDFTRGLADWKIDNPGGQPAGIARVDMDGPGPLNESDAFFVQTGGGGKSSDVNISQHIKIIDNGTYTLSANIAASYFPINPKFINSLSGGVITVTWDGTTIGSFDFGEIPANSWEYTSLSASFEVASFGILEINFFRPFESVDSPINYLDNVSLAFNNNRVVAPVPEPGTMLLVGVGIVGIAGCGRKKLKKMQPAT